MYTPAANTMEKQAIVPLILGGLAAYGVLSGGSKMVEGIKNRNLGSTLGGGLEAGLSVLPFIGGAGKAIGTGVRGVTGAFDKKMLGSAAAKGAGSVAAQAGSTAATQVAGTAAKGMGLGQRAGNYMSQLGSKKLPGWFDTPAATTWGELGYLTGASTLGDYAAGELNQSKNPYQYPTSF